MNVPSGYSALDLVGFTDKGDYSPSATYVKNDLVHYNGAIWKCLIDDTTGIVPTTGVNWDIWIDQSTSLDGLADVEITNATDGQEITYDATAQKWKNTSKIQTLTNKVKGNWSEGGKNLLPNKCFDATKDGVTYTVNNDGSIALSGTQNSSSNRYYQLSGEWGTVVADLKGFFYLPKGKTYVFSTNGTNDDTYGTNNVEVRLIVNGSTVIHSYDTLANRTFEVTTDDPIIATIFVHSSAVTDGYTFYPMIRLASITDDTYEPYAKTNQQLTEDTTGLLDNLEVNGAVNMLPNNATTQTINGITFTVNDDGSVTANGTATARTRIYLAGADSGNKYSLKRESLKTLLLRGCPNGGGDSSYKLIAQTGGSITGATIESYEDIGDGIILPQSTTELYLRAYILIIENATVSNLTFKPMITVPSYNGPYVPYAKSNKELTDGLDDLLSRFDTRFQIITLGGTARNVTKTITANENTRGFLGTWHPTDTAMNSDALYMIEIRRTDGVVWAKPIVEASGITVDTSQTGQLKFTNVGSGSVYPYLILINGDVTIS